MTTLIDQPSAAELHRAARDPDFAWVLEGLYGPLPAHIRTGRPPVSEWRVPSAGGASYHTSASDWTPAGPLICGYACVYGETHWGDPDEATEILPGAFDSILAGTSTTVAVIGHDLATVLATTEDDSLRIGSDEFGLRVEVTPHGPHGRRVAEAIEERGQLGMSLHYHYLPSECTYRETTLGRVIVVHRAIKLTEVTFSIDGRPGNRHAGAMTLDHIVNGYDSFDAVQARLGEPCARAIQRLRVRYK